MERRKFIKGTAAALSLPFWLQGCDFPLDAGFPISVHSDHHTGHLLIKSREWKRVDAGSVHTVIVGGGLAGVSSAMGLGHDDFKLFELSSKLGGTSSAINHSDIFISQGAHYDLAYPDYYGEEVLGLLERLNITKYEPWKKSWTFRDRQHVVPFARRQQCYEKGKIRREVMEEGNLKRVFDQLMSKYVGKMPLPTRLIAEENRYLNDLAFFDFLKEKLEIPATFKRQIDYHMMDDWGGTSDQVSALAGVHYFTCRPYLKQSVDLFSPPEGNHYFVRKMVSNLPAETLFPNHLVSKIEKTGEGFEVDVMDVINQETNVLKCGKVIFAGQKHTLKYIYPKDAHWFHQVQVPWMVLNFVCEEKKGEYGFWQNEYLGENPAFLGFIDSSVQDPKSLNGKRIMTAYYCLKPEDRNYLTTIPEHKDSITKETLGYIQEMLGKKLKVNACFIHVMGHAMSMPTQGFLFDDVNDKGPDLIYAGADNGRLPLLFEAVDSGLMAAKRV